MNYLGNRVIVSNECGGHPRVQVSAEFARLQSPELVAKTNAWMLEFFGRGPERMFATVDAVTGERVVYVSANAYAQLREYRAKEFEFSVVV